MRIADHAPALQSSQALQQPASTTHQQQVLAGEMATSALAKENDKKNTEVNRSEKAEHETIRGEDQGGGPTGGGRRNSRGEKQGENTVEPNEGPSPAEPGRGRLLDVKV